jgi:transcription antitermination factor NusG
MIYTPGPARWYALIVRPQAEGKAEAWLQVQGVHAFHPVTYRTVRVRGKAVTRTSRYLPGYVFARFPGEMIWHRVAANNHVADCIRMASGQPGILRPSDLTALYAMRDRDEEARQRERHARAIRPGNTVRILSGIFEGAETEVVEIRAGKAIVRLTLFGTPRDAEVDISQLGKA